MAIEGISASISGIGSPGEGGLAGVGEAPKGFGDAIAQGLEQVSDLERGADFAIQDVAAGGQTSVQELMVSTSKSQLGIEMLATVRDRAVEAYQEIMRMQV